MPDGRWLLGAFLAIGAGAMSFLLTEVLFITVVGTPWRPEGELLVADGLAVALALSLPLSLAAAITAFVLRRRGIWSLLPALVAPLCVVAAVVLNVEWLAGAGARVSAAATDAYRENGFFLVRSLWEALPWIAILVLFPLFIIALVFDILLLPVVILLTPAFLAAMAVFMLQCGLLIGAGIAVTCAICIPLLRWAGRPGDSA